MNIPQMYPQPTAAEEVGYGWVLETGFSDDGKQRTPDEKLAMKAVNAAKFSPNGVILVRSVKFASPDHEAIDATDVIQVKRGEDKENVSLRIANAWKNSLGH